MFPVFPIWSLVAHFCRDVVCNIVEEYIVFSQEKWDNWWNSVVPSLEPIVLNAVFEFNRAKIRAMIKLRIARRKYMAVDLLCQIAEHIGTVFKYIWILFTQHYVENPEQIWIKVFTQYDRLDMNCLYSDEEKLYSLKCEWPEIAELYKSFNYPVSEKTAIVTMPALFDEFVRKYTCLFSQLHVRMQEEDKEESQNENEENSEEEREDEEFQEEDTSLLLNYLFCEYLFCASRNHTLMVGKFGENIRVIRNICSSRPSIELELKIPEQSEVDFLAVEYTAMPGAEPISIEIPRSHYMVGNELLSRAYIYRYLRYLPVYVPWDFSEEYSVKCIDDALNEFYVNPGKCVVLREDTYEILDMDADICIAELSETQPEKERDAMIKEDEWEKVGESPR